MEISVTRDNGGTGVFKNDQLCNYDVYNVLAGDQRILTINSEDNTLIKKWTTELMKASKSRSIPLIAGISVDRENYGYAFYLSDKKYREKNPYSVLQICVGSNCLIYNLPERMCSGRSRYCYDDEVSKALCDFLSDPKLICVGVGIDEIAKKLDSAYGLKLANCADIRSLAEKAMGPKDQMWEGYMSKFGLDRMVSIVFGPDWKVDRPEKKVEWFDEYYENGYWLDALHPEKAMFLTIDAYLCYELGLWFLGKTDQEGFSSSSRNAKKKKKKVVEKRLKKRVAENLKKWSL